MPKKKWERPQLIVLVRGKPEEMVMAGCKSCGGMGPFTGPANTWFACSTAPVECAMCIGMCGSS